ncbi:MAG TPA: asparagine synthase C-terminal domain-containing protein [Armatimonadota bacterium]
MARFYFGISAALDNAPVLPRLRPWHVAALVFDVRRCGRRCVMYRIEPRLRSQELRGAAAEATPPAVIRLGDPADGTVELGERTLSLTVPLSGVRVIYYRSDPGGVWFSDDPRLLVRPGMALDDRWLLAQLELAANIAPLSPWKEIRCAPFGITLSVDLASLAVRESPAPFFREDGDSSPHGASDQERIEQAAEIFDDAMRRFCPSGHGVVLFSGGVDSGLIAARAARMGWRDVILVHTRRFRDDPETENARQMAEALRLRFDVFDYKPEEALSHLSGIFDFCKPVNDFAVIWHSTLAQQAIEAFPDEGIMMNGTGADALFRGIRNLRKVDWLYSVPAPVRRLCGRLYEAGNFWARDGRTENTLRIVRRSALWSFPSFAVVLNPLGEIAYHAPRGARREIAERIDGWVESVGRPLGPLQSKILGVLDNSATRCHSIVDVCEDAGVSPCFPFADPRLVAFALQVVTRWPESLREGKGVLKQLLVRSVPATQVYRPKAGFSIPPAETFAHPAFLHALQEVLETSSGPFSGLIDRPMVGRIYAAVEQRRRLAWFTYEFLWALVFGHHWITRIHEHSKGAQKAAAAGH